MFDNPDLSLWVTHVDGTASVMEIDDGFWEYCSGMYPPIWFRTRYGRELRMAVERQRQGVTWVQLTELEELENCEEAVRRSIVEESMAFELSGLTHPDPLSGESHDRGLIAWEETSARHLLTVLSDEIEERDSFEWCQASFIASTFADHLLGLRDVAQQALLLEFDGMKRYWQTVSFPAFDREGNSVALWSDAGDRTARGERPSKPARFMGKLWDNFKTWASGPAACQVLVCASVAVVAPHLVVPLVLGFAGKQADQVVKDNRFTASTVATSVAMAIANPSHAPVVLVDAAMTVCAQTPIPMHNRVIASDVNTTLTKDTLDFISHAPDVYGDTEVLCGRQNRYVFERREVRLTTQPDVQPHERAPAHHINPRVYAADEWWGETVRFDRSRSSLRTLVRLCLGRDLSPPVITQKSVFSMTQAANSYNAAAPDVKLLEELTLKTGARDTGLLAKHDSMQSAHRNIEHNWARYQSACAELGRPKAQ